MDRALLDGTNIAASLVVTAGLFFYLLPAMIASIRQVDRAGAIIVINVIFGWTVLGWIAALLWAITDKEQTRRSPTVANADQIAGSGLEYVKQDWRDPSIGGGLRMLGRAIFGEPKKFDNPPAHGPDRDMGRIDG